MFFEKPENLKKLEGFVEKFGKSEFDNELYQSRLNTVREVISKIIDTPKQWDDYCSFNISNLGERLLELLSGFDTHVTDKLNALHPILFKFVYEFYLNEQGSSGKIRSLIITMEDNTNGLLDNQKFSMMDTTKKMQFDMLRYEIQTSITGESSAYQSTINKAKKHIENLNEELLSKEKDVESLGKEFDAIFKSINAQEDRLKKHETAFNFVGLYDGFANLLIKKQKEGKWLLAVIILFGGVIFGTLTWKVIHVNSETELVQEITIDAQIANSTVSTKHKLNRENIDKEFNYSNIVSLLTFISLEVILIYFFRIALSNYQSVKAQIIQIELRQTLCQFIQSYSTFASKIKKEDSYALEKFENLIFSGIVADSDALPSAFDGLEQISKLIKSFKK